MGGVTYDIHRTVEALAEAAAAEAEAALAEALSLRGAASFVATGGSTPMPVYDRLSRADLAWEKVTVTLSDERWVPETDPASNAAMVRARLLRGPASMATFDPLMSGTGSPDADAQAASRRLDDLAPPFDLVMLGMGEDGHIASLFPGNPALAAGLHPDAPACIAVPPGRSRPPEQARLSLTLGPLKSARRIILLFSGHRKFDVLEAALNAADPYLYPVRALLSAPAGVRVICAS